MNASQRLTQAINDSPVFSEIAACTASWPNVNLYTCQSSLLCSANHGVSFLLLAIVDSWFTLCMLCYWRMDLPFIAAEIKASYLERHCRDLPLHKGYSLMSTLCVCVSFTQGWVWKHIAGIYSFNWIFKVIRWPTAPLDNISCSLLFMHVYKQRRHISCVLAVRWVLQSLSHFSHTQSHETCVLHLVL